MDPKGTLTCGTEEAEAAMMTHTDDIHLPSILNKRHRNARRLIGKLAAQLGRLSCETGFQEISGACFCIAIHSTWMYPSLSLCSIEYKIGLRILKAKLSPNLRGSVSCILTNYSNRQFSRDAQWSWMTTLMTKKKNSNMDPTERLSSYWLVHWGQVKGGRKTIFKGLNYKR